MDELTKDHAILHELLVKDLLKKLKDGTITPTEMNVARGLLRDNGITVESSPDTPLAILNDNIDPDIIPYPIEEAQ